MAEKAPWIGIDVPALAATLRRIDTGLLKQSPGVDAVWYQGTEPYFDVRFESGPEGINWFQFTFRGRSVTWTRATGRAVTGLTNERKIEEQPFPSSKTIAADPARDEELIAFVCELFAARPDEPLFATMAGLLKGP